MTQTKSSELEHPGKKRRERFLFALVGFLVFALHVGTVLYFVPLSLVFGDTLANLDYELIAGQNTAATHALNATGHPWMYDPSLNAGIPSGVEMDSNSRAWQLWISQVSKSFGPKGRGLGGVHNLFILFAHLLLPFALFFSSRLFGLKKWTTLLAVFLGSILWFFDGYLHWCWWSGSVAYGFAAYLSMLFLASIYRFFESERWPLAVVAAAIGFLAVFVHAYSIIPIVVVSCIFYGLNFKRLSTRQHLAALGIMAVTVLGNFHWIRLGLSFWSAGDNVPETGVAGLSYLLTDFLGINQDVNVSGGVGVRSGFRYLVFGAAAFTLAYWRSETDSRYRPFLYGVASLLAMAYLGGYIPGLREAQPYRHIVLAILLATMPAAQFVREAVSRGALRDLPRMAQVVLVLIALAAIPRLARDVVYFVPHFAIVPKDLPEETPHISDIIGFGGIGYPRHRDYRQRPSPAYMEKLVRGLRAWEFSQGRVLVEYGPLAERLTRLTKAHIVGGSTRRNRSFRAADIFTRFPSTEPSLKTVEEYFDTYAIGWVIIMSNPDLGDAKYAERFRGMGQLFEGQKKAWPFQVMRIKANVSYFKEGFGKIETSSNRIVVKESPPDRDIVLKFHWLKTLSCGKGCAIKRDALEGDALGFIRVTAPHPADFVIENKYR